MRYLLDTNICIYLIKSRSAALLAHFSACEVGEIGISAITVAELCFGVEKSQYPDRNRAALEQFLLPLLVVAFDWRAAEAYGRLRTTLETQGTPIGALDTLIAAQAVSLDVTLVTNNVREFSRVPGLRWENWT